MFQEVRYFLGLAVRCPEVNIGNDNGADMKGGFTHERDEGRVVGGGLIYGGARRRGWFAHRFCEIGGKPINYSVP